MDEANGLCWDSGLGYGNQWCQRLTSPQYTYTGSGTIALSFKYFNDSEANFDYSKVEILKEDGTYGTPLNAPGFNDIIGDPATGSYPTYNTNITATQIGGTTFHLVFEFTSDGGWSDEDGYWATAYGPFGADDVSLSGSISGGPFTYGFDSDLQGWTPSGCLGKGSYFAVHDISNYVIQDPCACRLDGNIVAWHDDFGVHPEGQHELSESPPADRASLGSGYNRVLTQYDMYAEMPQANGVFERVGFKYYPYICPATGQPIWSPRVGDSFYHYVGDTPRCSHNVDDVSSSYVPATCQYVKFVFEVYNSCDAFGIASTICTHISNATPLLDNMQLRITGIANAPIVSFEPGTSYSDGFGQQLLLSSSALGDANIVLDLHRDDPTPDKLGDSLLVAGPVVTDSTKFESRLWFRLKRIGPAQNSIAGYTAWRNRVTIGAKPDNIVGPTAAFTWGYMDSAQVGNNVYKNKFDSFFREDDPSANPGAPPNGDRAKQNGIILDQILVPGTKIEYFVTSNFMCLPTTLAYLPDTTGKYYASFEILPSYRTVAGVDKFPCVLYVDAYGGTYGQRGVSSYYLRNGLNWALNGQGAAIADPTNWDFFNYQDASSNVNAPLARNVSGNAGASLPELLGYKLILINTGRYPNGCMDWRDWSMFGDWLSATTCNGNQNYQGLIAQGDNIAQVINHDYPVFLNNYMGAIFKCDSYNVANCGPNPADENYCLKLTGVSGGAWQPATAIDAYGNWCPAKFAYDVVTTTNGGAGNKAYTVEGGTTVTSYEEITRQEASPGKYRTVLSGVAAYHTTRRDVVPVPPYESFAPCPPETTHILDAVYSELNAAIKWTLGIADPTQIGYCTDPCQGGVDVNDPGVQGGSAFVNALNGNYPNPFNPRTELRFSLAQAGPVQLVIYDVSGRQVKTLVNGVRAAGPNSVWWDGSDDSGHRVSAGVYWSKLTAGTFSSNKKMVILK